jgi:hypothetical protein
MEHPERFNVIPKHELNDQGEGVCSTCGKFEDLRPYGPNFSWICYECGKKDNAGTSKRMGHLLYGDPL